jgi:hypothetical protein
MNNYTALEVAITLVFIKNKNKKDKLCLSDMFSGKTVGTIKIYST